MLVIAIGGAMGSVARYGLAVALPHDSGDFAVSTLLANVAGCVVIGLLMAAITEATRPHRLLRPFLGIGVLGGFTTYSTYVIDVTDAVSAGATAVATLYALGTVLGCLAAVIAGLACGRVLLRRQARRGARERATRHHGAS
nr:fluoride efflux transporter CrcB [Haloechinothrix sp. LS1_15]